MAVTDVNMSGDDRTTARSAGALRRLTTETKAAVKTTELYAYVAVLAGVLIAAAATKAGSGHDDRFIAKEAWLFVTILTVGYLVSRGLAKSGSREPYSDDADNR